MTGRDGSADDVLLTTDGHAGRITLNRPRALNALTHAMVRNIDAALAAWERDPAVRTVVLTGAGERGLCAGGDIRAIHDDARARGGESAAFWYDEYRLNARIARYPKPYVALMDGIVMGGGVGLSAHGSVRVVTERSRVAMPETGIGFVPDVGGTHLLARAPGELGTHLALTGAQAGAADALLCGLADHYVPSAELPGLLRDLAHTPAREAVARYARRLAGESPTGELGAESGNLDAEPGELGAEPGELDAPPGELGAARGWIDVCYGADTVEEIVERLHADGSRGAKEAAETLAARSPTSLKVTLAALRRARRLGALEPVLEQEYRVSCACLDAPDLVEGVRAQIIDKDRSPRWDPASLGEVTDADVERFFASRAGGGLGLGTESGSGSGPGSGPGPDFGSGPGSGSGSGPGMPDGADGAGAPGA